jgi:hypothetical protein
MNRMIPLPQLVRIAIAAVVLSAVSLPFAFAQEVNDAEAHNQQTWQEAIAQTEVPEGGCFHASYPSLTWNEIECTVAPNIPIGLPDVQIGNVVGNGNDYAAEVTSGLINKSLGSFPKVTGVKKETGDEGANSYSLQLNSNRMNTAPCSGAAHPKKCRTWVQFAYQSSAGLAFMSYWLLDYINPCPSGWFGQAGYCFINSSGVAVPLEVIGKLKTLKLSGSAKKGGSDTLVMIVGTEAYTTSEPDSLVDLATAWTESEFNVFGTGGGSRAFFNAGSSITVKVNVWNGTTDVPTCAANAGTTAETTNLNLGSCSGTGGAVPYIEFTESN